MASSLDERRAKLREAVAKGDRAREVLDLLEQLETAWAKFSKQPEFVQPALVALAERACAECGAPYTPKTVRAKGRQRFCSIRCRNRANSRARPKRQRRPANGGGEAEAASEADLAPLTVELACAGVVVIGEDLAIRQEAPEAADAGSGHAPDSYAATTIGSKGAGSEAASATEPSGHRPDGSIARNGVGCEEAAPAPESNGEHRSNGSVPSPDHQRRCIRCGAPVSTARHSSCCTDRCRPAAASARIAATRNLGWQFAVDERLYGALGPVRIKLRPHDLAVVQRRRAQVVRQYTWR